MAIDNLDVEDRLECGRTVEQVWSGLHSPADAHTENCDACLAARENLLRLDEAVQSVADDDQPEPQVKSRIMEVARREARRGRRIPLQRSTVAGADDLAVTEQAVIEVTRRTADRSGDLLTRRVSVRTATGTTLIADDGIPTAVAIRLRVSVRAGSAIPAAAAEVRTAVGNAVRESTGLLATTIDVDVEDVFTDSPAADSNQDLVESAQEETHG